MDIRIILSICEPLSIAFSSCRELFVSMLNVQDAAAADFLNEICNENSSGHLNIPRSTIKDLLLTLCTYDSTAPELDDAFKQLAQMEVVPVRKSQESRFSVCKGEWFIPDCPRYANRFKGKLWFLDFSKEEIISLKALFTRMDLMSREISQHVEEQTITDSACAVYYPQLTKELPNKSLIYCSVSPWPSKEISRSGC
jgi:hypothetical protein